MATDQTQVLELVGDLLAVGAHRGAAQVIRNALLIAQREAAEVRDLPKRPVFGKRVKPTPQPDAANENHSPASSDTA